MEREIMCIEWNKPIEDTITIIIGEEPVLEIRLDGSAAIHMQAFSHSKKEFLDYMGILYDKLPL